MNGKGWLLVALGAGLLLAGGRKVVDLKNASANERRWAPVIAAAETRHGIPAGLLHRLIKRESHFRTDIITGQKLSPVGAYGIAQFMPATGAEMGIYDPATKRWNPDPAAHIEASAKYLARLKKAKGSWDKALGSYNWGIGNVGKAEKASPSNWLAAVWPVGHRFAGMPMVPTETKNYVKEILG